MRKPVGVVRHMPRVLVGVETAFGHLVLFVFGRLRVIKEAHEGAVGDEGHDALGLVVPEFESPDPDEDHQNGDPEHTEAEPLRIGGDFQKAVKQAGKFLHHRYSVLKVSMMQSSAFPPVRTMAGVPDDLAIIPFAGGNGTR